MTMAEAGFERSNAAGRAEVGFGACILHTPLPKKRLPDASLNFHL
jgi:hypothetical protein